MSRPVACPFKTGMKLFLLWAVAVVPCLHFSYQNMQQYILKNHDVLDSSIVVAINEQASPSPSQEKKTCPELRGLDGFWFLDDDFGIRTFYAYQTRSRKFARENNPNKTAYGGNSYNWKDKSPCEIQTLNQTYFCETMDKLAIKRLFFVGDSLTFSQVGSLLGLLGLKADAIRETVNTITRRGKSTIQCPNHQSIAVEAYRQNLGPNFGMTNLSGRNDSTIQHQQQFGPEIPFCGKGKDMDDMIGNFCSWHLKYNATKERTLVVLNQGAHFHSMETFAGSFDQFVSLFNTIAHPNDIVVFRATVPGHFDCFNQFSPEIPPHIMTHDKFLERYATTMYDWNLFDSYNHYAKQRLLRDLVPTVIPHYLNVYNMTVLRGDEHVKANDCLHYMPPGPVDWWNHLLFTNLVDLPRQANFDDV